MPRKRGAPGAGGGGGRVADLLQVRVREANDRQHAVRLAGGSCGSHALGAHFDDLEAVLEGERAGVNQRGVLAQRQAGAGGGAVRRARILRAQLLHRGQAGHEQRRLRILRLVKLRLGPCCVVVIRGAPRRDDRLASQRTVGADGQQVVAQHALGGVQHGGHGGQVLAALQHANRLRPLAREQERNRRGGRSRRRRQRHHLRAAREQHSWQSQEQHQATHPSAVEGGGAALAARRLLRLHLGLLLVAAHLLRVRVLVAAEQGMISTLCRNALRMLGHALLGPLADRLGPVVIQRPPVADVRVRLRHLRKQASACCVCHAPARCGRVAHLGHVGVERLQRQHALAHLRQRCV